MIKRLKEFIDQTKGISTTGVIYFCNGYTYTFDKDQLLQAKTDIRGDKKGGEYFSDKTFKVEIDAFLDFYKNYTKSISTLVFHDDKSWTIQTTIPTIELTTSWTKQDTVQLIEIQKFFKDIEAKADKNSEDFLYEHIFTAEELTRYTKEKLGRMFTDIDDNSLYYSEDAVKNSGHDYLMVSIFPKYLGKLGTSSKDFTMQLYFTPNESIYLCHFSVHNSSLITDYYGLTSDLIIND